MLWIRGATRPQTGVFYKGISSVPHDEEQTKVGELAELNEALRALSERL
jgi:hypothetical protein